MHLNVKAAYEQHAINPLAHSSRTTFQMVYEPVESKYIDIKTRVKIVQDQKWLRNSGKTSYFHDVIGLKMHHILSTTLKICLCFREMRSGTFRK